MVTLQQINQTNFMDVAALQVQPAQKPFVASPLGILARAYAYRDCRPQVWGIYSDGRLVGLALVEDLEAEPACYHLTELLVDAKAQGRGYGQAALSRILSLLQRERKYPMVEVCVKKENAAAIHVYEKAGFRDTGYEDPVTPDSLCMAYPLRAPFTGVVTIRNTGLEDLKNVQRLWADPSVMHFVGFPEGLHETLEHLEQSWLPWVQQPPKRQHWSVYADGVGYCGETFYEVDDTGLACMDIKLLSSARGKGIAQKALSYALTQAFQAGGADRAYVDPSPENTKAVALYASLGFLPAQRPAHLEPWDSLYFELTRQDWEARHGA